MPGRLQFKGEYSKSLVAKFATIVGLSIAILASGWLMFAGTDTVTIEGDVGRQVTLLACSVVYAARLSVTLFVFLRRRIAWWEGVLGSTLFPFLLFCLAYIGGSQDQPIDGIDALGIALYAVGSYLGTRSELSRHVWKMRLENQGHLYTQGLFKYSRHINYFGDVVLFSGFALIATHDAWALVVPLAMALSFVLVIIPAHDAYLADRYGEEFREYAERTKKLIPLVY